MTNDDGDVVLILVNQVVPSMEAYLTLDLEEGSVFGRIGASDGSVYLIRPNLEYDKHHVWIKVKDKDVREEEEDLIEVCCIP